MAPKKDDKSAKAKAGGGGGKAKKKVRAAVPPELLGVPWSRLYG